MKNIKYILFVLILFNSSVKIIYAQPQSCYGHASMNVSTSGVSATITPSGPTTFCAGGSVVLNANTGTGYTYQWKLNNGNISGATASAYTASSSGSYTVVVTNSTGSSATSSAVIVTKLPKPTATITPQGPTTFCAGGSVVLSANTGAGLTYKWKKNGSNIAGASQSNYTATTAGKYVVQVTKPNGCSRNSAAVIVTVNCKSGEVSVNENSINTSIVPNPFSEEASLLIDEKVDLQNAELIITDVIGRQVRLNKIKDNHSLTIIKNELNKGMYFYHLNNNNSTVASGKFIIE